MENQHSTEEKSDIQLHIRDVRTGLYPTPIQIAQVLDQERERKWKEDQDKSHNFYKLRNVSTLTTSTSLSGSFIEVDLGNNTSRVSASSSSLQSTSESMLFFKYLSNLYPNTTHNDNIMGNNTVNIPSGNTNVNINNYLRMEDSDNTPLFSLDLNTKQVQDIGLFTTFSSIIPSLLPQKSTFSFPIQKYQKGREGGTQYTGKNVRRRRTERERGDTGEKRERTITSINKTDKNDDINLQIDSDTDNNNVKYNDHDLGLALDSDSPIDSDCKVSKKVRQREKSKLKTKNQRLGTRMSIGRSTIRSKFEKVATGNEAGRDTDTGTDTDTDTDTDLSNYTDISGKTETTETTDETEETEVEELQEINEVKEANETHETKQNTFDKDHRSNIEKRKKKHTKNNLLQVNIETCPICKQNLKYYIANTQFENFFLQWEEIKKELSNSPQKAPKIPSITNAQPQSKSQRSRHKHSNTKHQNKSKKDA